MPRYGRRPGRVALGLALLLTAGMLNARDLLIDSTRSSAAFRVHLFGIFSLNGTLPRVAGDLDLDEARGLCHIEARLDATALDMDSQARANWAKSDEFFDVEHYPEIRFVSDPFAISELDSGGRLLGELSLRGVTAPVEFLLAPSACAPARDPECHFEVRGQVSRTAFGMRSRRAILGDAVELSIQVVVRTEP